MKNYLKKLGVLAFLMLFSVLINSPALAGNEPGDSQGVDVQIEKLRGEVVLWINCGEGWIGYEAKSGKVQIKNDVVHLETWVIKLPLDNCFVPSPEAGAYKMEIWGGTLLLNPSGIVIFKGVFNNIEDE
jgi:hypothetical protein